MTAEAWELAAAFILARIDEEAVGAIAARDQDDSDWWWNCPESPAEWHMSRHAPTVEIRRSEAQRRILTRCVEVLKNSSHHTTVESCDEDEAVLAQEILYDLASSWDTHPDYPAATP